jgi:hypothetical protein
MKSRVFSLITALITSWVALGLPANAFKLNGSWATSPSVCGQVFMKKDGAILFRQDSDQYGGGFIMQGNKVGGQTQTCNVTRRKEEGDVIHMVAMCATDIMASNVQLSAKIVDDNTIARIFPGMPEFTLNYSRYPM